LNGEEKQFFTKLFSGHAQLLGKLEEGQRDIREDIGEVKVEQRELRRRLNEKCADKHEVDEAIGVAVTGHYDKYHDPDKVTGKFINENKHNFLKVALIVLIIVDAILGTAYASTIM